MRVASLFFPFLIFIGTHANSIKSFKHNEIEQGHRNEPRIFFKQVVEASGLFPIEINVPDTISAMMSGMSSMYQAVSSYFGGGSEGDSEGGEQQVSYDEVDLNSRPISGKHRKKKVKRVKKKPDVNDDNDNLFDLFDFTMF